MYIKLNPIEDCKRLDDSLCGLPKRLWDIEKIHCVYSHGYDAFRVIDERKMAKGYYIPSYFVRKIVRDKTNDMQQTEKIVFVKNGNAITAKHIVGKNVVKTATTKCSPDDSFDMVKGCMIALSRLA